MYDLSGKDRKEKTSKMTKITLNNTKMDHKEDGVI
jgi:hypothetical protein